ncbi:hypothetical protein Aperf_G00000125471 [Anoplocephala perfoliata]
MIQLTSESNLAFQIITLWITSIHDNFPKDKEGLQLLKGLDERFKEIIISIMKFGNELSDMIDTDDFGVQTEYFIDRPPSPLIAKTLIGIDAQTQIGPSELFNFDAEVVPLLEALLNKTLEQSLMEVIEEEELASIRAKQATLEEIRNAEKAEVERLEVRNKRRRLAFREEQEGRRKQSEYMAMIRRQTMEKIAARSFVKTYLEPLLSDTFEQLTARGYFYDDVKSDLEVNFLNGLVAEVLQQNVLERRGRIIIDEIIKDAVRQRHKGYRELGRAVMVDKMMSKIQPALLRRIANDTITMMVDLSIDRLELISAAGSTVHKRTAEFLLDEAVNKLAEELAALADIAEGLELESV